MTAVATLIRHDDSIAIEQFSGLVYDVATGRLETVVEPGPLRDE